MSKTRMYNVLQEVRGIWEALGIEAGCVKTGWPRPRPRPASYNQFQCDEVPWTKITRWTVLNKNTGFGMFSLGFDHLLLHESTSRPLTHSIKSIWVKTIYELHLVQFCLFIVCELICVRSFTANSFIALLLGRSSVLVATLCCLQAQSTIDEHR